MTHDPSDPSGQYVHVGRFTKVDGVTGCAQALSASFVAPGLGRLSLERTAKGDGFTLTLHATTPQVPGSLVRSIVHRHGGVYQLQATPGAQAAEQAAAEEQRLQRARHVIAVAHRVASAAFDAANLDGSNPAHAATATWQVYVRTVAPQAISALMNAHALILGAYVSAWQTVQTALDAMAQGQHLSPAETAALGRASAQERVLWPVVQMLERGHQLDAFDPQQRQHALDVLSGQDPQRPDGSPGWVRAKALDDVWVTVARALDQVAALLPPAASGAFPYRQVPASHGPAQFIGSNSQRAGVGDPGHCEACVSVGHKAAHPELGCGDVGCYASHEPAGPGAR